MSECAAALADRFEQVNDLLIALIERCSDVDWQTVCAAEGWPAGVVAHHVAAGYPPELDCIKAFVTGQPLPPGYAEWAMIDQSNAQHADRHAGCNKAETLALLRQNGAAVAGFIRNLSKVQLARAAWFPLMGENRTAQRMIERILIGHAEEHLGSLRAALSRRDAEDL